LFFDFVLRDSKLVTASLLIAVGRNPSALKELIWPIAGTVLAVAFLVWLFLRVRAWFHEDEGPADSAHEMLGQYREMQRQGVLTDEEFRFIKRRLAAEIASAPGSGGLPPLPALNPTGKLPGAAPGAEEQEVAEEEVEDEKSDETP
jgi:hypothetical protein